MVKWRGLLGIALTCFIAIPYVMGADVEKYLRGWVDAANQKKGQTQFELQHYQRHWFYSEGDLLITSFPLQKKLTVHFTASHGPFFFKAGPGHHWGLSYIHGQLDSAALFTPDSGVQATGPLLFTAFVPYFNDRELETHLPAITIRDKGNNLVYQLPPTEISLDNEGFLQWDLPTLTVSRPEGDEKLSMSTALLRVQPEASLASFSAQEIQIPLEGTDPLRLQHFLLKAAVQAKSPVDDLFSLSLKAHFDQLKTKALELGPFDFSLNLNGLQRQGLHLLLKTFNTLSLEKTELKPEQNQALAKGVSTLFAPDALFDLNGNVNTAQGPIEAQFRGGLHPSREKSPWQNPSELVDAFFSKGVIRMSAETKQALLSYSNDPQNLALPLLLSALKPQGQGYYSAQLAIEEGILILNGKNQTSDAF